MKKILLSIFSLIIVFTSLSQGQIDNGDMESWENVSGGGVEPVNWNSFLSANGTWSTFSGDQCEPSSETRPGSNGTKSCRIFSNEVFGTVANGNVTLGRIHMGSTNPTSSDNYNKTVTGNSNFSQALTDQPDSIVYWVKFTPKIYQTYLL